MPSTGTTPGLSLELHRVPTSAELVIAAPRAAVWAAADADEETEVAPQLIVGAPTSGVGARQVFVGPPLPPFGMRTVMYLEVTGYQEGYWYSAITLAGDWEHTETFTLADTADGQTLARISGWWTKPAPPGTNFKAAQTLFSEHAAKRLKRIADRVEVRATEEPGETI